MRKKIIIEEQKIGLNMMAKKVKKKLSFNRTTIWKLNIKLNDVLGMDTQKNVNGGPDNTIEVKVGVTEHPKYC